MSGSERNRTGGRLLTTCSRIESLAMDAAERVVGSSREKEEPSSTLPCSQDRSGPREEAVRVDVSAMEQHTWALENRGRRPRWMTRSTDQKVNSCWESTHESTNGFSGSSARPRPFQGERVAEARAGGRSRRPLDLPLIGPSPKDAFQVATSTRAAIGTCLGEFARSLLRVAGVGQPVRRWDVSMVSR